MKHLFFAAFGAGFWFREALTPIGDGNVVPEYVFSILAAGIAGSFVALSWAMAKASTLNQGEKHARTSI